MVRFGPWPERGRSVIAETEGSGVGAAERTFFDNTLRLIRTAAFEVAKEKCLWHCNLEGDGRSELVYRETDRVFELLCKAAVTAYREPRIDC